MKDGGLQPGDRVSTDQYECRIKGILPYTKGKERSTEDVFQWDVIYRSCNWIHVNIQCSLFGRIRYSTKPL